MDRIDWINRTGWMDRIGLGRFGDHDRLGRASSHRHVEDLALIGRHLVGHHDGDVMLIEIEDAGGRVEAVGVAGAAVTDDLYSKPAHGFSSANSAHGAPDISADQRR